MRIQRRRNEEDTYRETSSSGLVPEVLGPSPKRGRVRCGWITPIDPQRERKRESVVWSLGRVFDLQQLGWRTNKEGCGLVCACVSGQWGRASLCGLASFQRCLEYFHTGFIQQANAHMHRMLNLNIEKLYFSYNIAESCVVSPASFFPWVSCCMWLIVEVTLGKKKKTSYN